MAVTPFEHTLIGALSGSVEVVLMQPTVAIKNALQEGRPVPMNPSHLYRGLPMNVVSMAPITASQFGANRLFTQNILRKNDTDLTSAERFAGAAVAGAASAFIASPSELVIIHQQKSGMTLSAQASTILKNEGFWALRRGLLPAIGRETLYAAGYLGLFPILKKALDEADGQTLSPGATTAIAGITSGFFGAFCSHPFDTVKTKMQANMYSNAQYATLRSTFYNIYTHEGGITQLWKGMLPRMFRIICATFILNAVRTNAVNYLEDARK